jgi:hypothetical protein
MLEMVEFKAVNVKAYSDYDEGMWVYIPADTPKKEMLKYVLSGGDIQDWDGGTW